jgi:hypothetical protein
MCTAIRELTYAAVLACVAAAAPLQADAAEDTASKGQGVTSTAAPGMPSKTDSADVAFKKLDRSAKGYVTLEDVAGLPGFATAFTNADSSHLGRLNLTAFTRAWTAYVEGKY